MFAPYEFSTCSFTFCVQQIMNETEKPEKNTQNKTKYQTKQKLR